MVRNENNQAGGKASLILVIVFFLVGLPFLLIGLWFINDHNEFLKGAVTTEATVISVAVNHSSDSTTYRPTVTFMDAEGHLQKARTGISSSGYDYDVGAKIDVMYNLAHDSDIRIVRSFVNWGFGAIFAIVGGALTLVALLVLMRRGRGRGINGQPTQATNARHGQQETRRLATAPKPHQTSAVRRNR